MLLLFPEAKYAGLLELRDDYPLFELLYPQLLAQDIDAYGFSHITTIYLELESIINSL
jgi:hypothetical protein